jgi:hypothetical protein
MTTTDSAETYERYEVGDDVWCLGWIGMPFTVVGKDDDKQIIQIDGVGPCSLPGGARIDLVPQHHFMLSHQMWDSIWYWPDIAGEHYREVFDRFVDKHSEGQLVTGHMAGGVTVSDNPDAAVAFRLSLTGVSPFGQIYGSPVVAIAENGTEILTHLDPEIPDDRWIPSAPLLPLEMKMVGFRWALCYGKFVLNWEDFD